MLTTSDLKQIQGLCGYLTKNMYPSGGDLASDCTLIDLNGDEVGRVKWSQDVSEYVFEMDS